VQRKTTHNETKDLYKESDVLTLADAFSDIAIALV